MGLFGGKRDNTSSGDSSSPISRAESGVGTTKGASSRGTESNKIKQKAIADVRSPGGSKNQATPERGRAPQAGGESVANIGKSLIIKGDLSGDEDLVIDGNVEGRINLPNNQVTVGADGRITAEIEAKSIIIVGQTAGNLTASERLEVQATAVVDGDIRAPRLLIEEGAVVNGKIEMSKSPVSARGKQPAQAAPAASTGGAERKSA